MMTSPPAPIHSKAALRVSFAAGVLVLAVTLLFSLQEPAHACGNWPSNHAPIIAFELARRVADLQAPCGDAQSRRAALIEHLDAINRVDLRVCTLAANGAASASSPRGGSGASFGTVPGRAS